MPTPAQAHAERGTASEFAFLMRCHDVHLPDVLTRYYFCRPRIDHARAMRAAQRAHYTCCYGYARYDMRVCGARLLRSGAT